jgi:hypothetical protein
MTDLDQRLAGLRVTWECPGLDPDERSRLETVLTRLLIDALTEAVEPAAGSNTSTNRLRGPLPAP